MLDGYLALYQGMASAVPRYGDEKHGFSRWNFRGYSPDYHGRPCGTAEAMP